MAARSSTGLIPPPSRPPPTAYVARQRSRHGLPEQIVATPSKIKFEHSFIPSRRRRLPLPSRRPHHQPRARRCPPSIPAGSARRRSTTKIPTRSLRRSNGCSSSSRRCSGFSSSSSEGTTEPGEAKWRRSSHRRRSRAVVGRGGGRRGLGSLFHSQGDGDEEEEEEDELELEGLDSSGASPDVQHGPSYLRNGTLKPTALRIRPESSTRALEEADIDEAQIELDEEDELFDAPRSRYFLGRAADALARVRPRPPKEEAVKITGDTAERPNVRSEHLGLLFIPLPPQHAARHDFVGAFRAQSTPGDPLLHSAPVLSHVNRAAGVAFRAVVDPADAHILTLCIAGLLVLPRHD